MFNNLQLKIAVNICKKDFITTRSSLNDIKNISMVLYFFLYIYFLKLRILIISLLKEKEMMKILGEYYIYYVYIIICM